MKTEDFRKVTIEEATKTPTKSGHYDLVTDSWWGVTEDDCILYYRGYARQCNMNKSVADSIISMKNHPAVKLMFFEKVWEKHNCSDYN